MPTYATARENRAVETLTDEQVDRIMAERMDDAIAQFEKADCLYSAAEVEAMHERMAAEITDAVAGLDPVILCVMMGGFFPAAEIVKRLDFPFEFDYLHASRYREGTTGGELIWKVSPGLPLAERNVLVIDDILDEGQTLQAILNALHGQQAASVRTAILLRKTHDRCIEGLDPDFLGGEVPDRYVFGVGMDYKGYFRQLPAVYALADQD